MQGHGVASTKLAQKEKPRCRGQCLQGFFMVSSVGIEPTTHALKVRCSTD